MQIEVTITIIQVKLSNGRVKVTYEVISLEKLLAKGNSYMYIQGK